MTQAGLDRIARSALARWDVPADAGLRLLKYRENAVYAVDIGGEPRYVLRMHRPGYHSDAALRSELEWMTALNEHGVPTPRVVPTSGGDCVARVPGWNGSSAYQCDLLSWVPGVPLGSIESRSFGRQDFVVRAYEMVGRLAAQVHMHSEAWQPADSFARHRWDEDGCLGPRAVWGYYAELDSLTAEQRALLKRGAEAARRRLGEFGKARHRFGLIHADLIPENVLIDGESCTLVDFDDSGYGWYVADIATAVFFQVGTESFAPALHAMLHGYRQVRPLSATDLEMLDVMLLLRGLAVLGWVRTRAETETAAQIRGPVTEISLNLAARLAV